ncbi:hypothetical protein BSKO_11896 [Bryopsis sp. KO-2023]|nr:hypothetical protein BSKO_11896 [Bryopsis sp. KO-2023]
MVMGANSLGLYNFMEDPKSIIRQFIPDFLYPVIFHPRKAIGELAKSELYRIDRLNDMLSNVTVEGGWSLRMDRAFDYDPGRPWWRHAEKGEFNRTLYLRPLSGLGNQLQTIASALTLARVEGFNVKIVFDKMGKYIKYGPNFQWSDMFVQPPVDFNDTFPGGSRSFPMQCTVHYAFHWHEVRNKWEKGSDGNEILCIRACCLDAFPTRAWIPYTQWFYRSLVPADNVLKMVDDFKRQFDWDMFTWIGVHVRRTDRPWTVFLLLKRVPFGNYLDLTTGDYNDILPVRAIVEEMNLFKKILSPFGSQTSAAIPRPARFFLATDDQAIGDEIIKSFARGEVVNVPKHMSASQARSRKDGMQLAVLDMVLLASCRALVGSAYSSFSKAAAFMGDGFYTEPYYSTTWENET